MYLLQESCRTHTPLPHYNSDTSVWSDHKTASIDCYSDTTSEPSYTYHEHQHSLHSMLTTNGPLHSTLNYPLHSTLLDAPAHTCTAHHVTATGTARCQTTHNSTYTVLSANNSTYPVLPAHNSTYPVLPAHNSTYPVLPAHNSTYPVLPAHNSTYPDLPAHNSTYPVLPAHNSTYTVLPGRPDDKQDEVKRKLELICRMKRFQKQLMKRGLNSFKVLAVL